MPEAFKRCREYQSLKYVFQSKFHQDGVCSWVAHEIKKKKSDYGTIRFPPIFLFIYLLLSLLSLISQVLEEHRTLLVLFFSLGRRGWNGLWQQC